VKFRTKDYFSFTSHSAFGASPAAWFRILFQNRFLIHPLLIPKVIFISGAVIFSMPFQWYEKLRYRKKLEEVKIKNPVFILGHPRSGTTFLHYIMSRDPSFGYCTTVQAMIPHLFLTWSGFFSGLLAKALPEKRPMDDMKMGSALPKEEEFALAGYGVESIVTGYYFPKNFSRNFRRNVLFQNNSSGEKRWKKNFDHFLRKLSLNNNGKTLLLKSPANTARVKAILSLYPDAKFIHIYRNPFDVYQSHLHLFKKLLPMLSFQQVSDEELEETVFETYIDIHEKYFAEKTLIPSGNLIEVKYENFIADPLKQLANIYRAINLENFEVAKAHFEEELKSYSDYSKNKFTLSSELAEKISERFDFAFREFGYSKSTYNN
jgi:hypothetical protein